MAAAAPRAFSWLKGRVEIYPLLAVLGLGVGLTGYSCGRHLITNPDVTCVGVPAAGPGVAHLKGHIAGTGHWQASCCKVLMTSWLLVAGSPRASGLQARLTTVALLPTGPRAMSAPSSVTMAR
jgi:hypothetical protein